MIIAAMVLGTQAGWAICVYYPSSDRGRTSGTDRDPCNRGSGWPHNDRNDTAVDFVVRLPAGLRVDAKTVSGDLIGTGLRGTLDLGTVSGDLRLTDVEGDVLEVSTVSGDVTFAGPIDNKGRYDFKTLSGDVVMTLPRQPDAVVSAVTFSGDLDSVFPITQSGRSRRHRFTATWGAGTATLDLESFSGDIKIREAN